MPGILDALGKPTAAMHAEATEGFSFLGDAVKFWVDALPASHSSLDMLRASGLHRICPREFVLNYWQPQANRSFDWKSQMMMSTGTHLHYLIQNRILGPMGILWGKWGNKETGEVVEGFHPDHDRAVYEMTHEYANTWEYLETNVWHEGWRISGHMDGLVSAKRMMLLWANRAALKTSPLNILKKVWDTPPESLRVLEIKTCSKYIMENLSGPRDIADYYQVQTVAYQKLSGMDKTVFWYVERDSMDSEFILFPYKHEWWTTITRKAKLIWESIKNETLPESMMACKTPKDKRAKECVHCTNCWSDRFNFAEYVQIGKERAAKEGRTLLDLSSWEAPVE